MTALVLLSACFDITTPPQRATAYFGEWSGPNASLTITEEKIVWRKKGTFPTYVTAAFKGLSGADIVYGGSKKKRLMVTSPPREKGGVWKMTVEGERLERR